MPSYTLECQQGHVFEVFQSINAPNPRCPRCGAGAEKIIGETQRPIWKCNPETPGGGWTSKRPKRFLDGLATRRRGEGWKVEKHRT